MGIVLYPIPVLEIPTLERRIPRRNFGEVTKSSSPIVSAESMPSLADSSCVILPLNLFEGEFKIPANGNSLPRC